MKHNHICSTLRTHISNFLLRLGNSLSPTSPMSPGKKKEAPSTNTQDIRHIYSNGWRQGSVIDKDSITLPEKFSCHNEDDYYILICSQSCTVVSPDISKDPYVEAVLAKPIQKYNSRSPEARGKNQRKLHLPVNGGDNFEALEIQLKDRFELPRQNLTDILPKKDITLNKSEVLSLASWLGRNYTRIALPDTLVQKLKETGFRKELEDWFKTKLNDDATIADKISNIYISWKPDEEADKYEVKMVFICDNEPDTVGNVTSNFDDKISSLDYPDLTLNLSCEARDAIYLSDLDGLHRFSEFDYLTQMEEWHQMYDIIPPQPTPNK